MKDITKEIKLKDLNIKFNDENNNNLNNVNLFEKLLYKIIENKLSIIKKDFIYNNPIYFSEYNFKIVYNFYTNKLQFDNLYNDYLNNIRFIIDENINNLGYFVNNILNIIDEYILNYIFISENINKINIELYHKL